MDTCYHGLMPLKCSKNLFTFIPFSSPFSLLPCGSCRVLPIMELNWLFPCINQNLHIWNFPISLWEDDCFPDRGLLGSLMRQKNALQSSKSCSLSLYHVGSCTLAIPSTCSCPCQVSPDDHRCYRKGPFLKGLHICTAPAWNTFSPLATYLNKLSSLSVSLPPSSLP